MDVGGDMSPPQVLVESSLDLKLCMDIALTGLKCPMSLEYNTTDYYKISDCKPFADRKIPNILISGGLHKDYHTIRDTPDLLRPDAIKASFDVIEAIVKQFT